MGGRGRFDLGQRCVDVGSDADEEPVAELELASGDHGRHLALPEKNDRGRVEGERLGSAG
jgi:hypothetical protein